MSRFKTKSPAEEIYERCACCKKELDIPRNTPINLREHYIRGCGQLCPECYAMIMLEERANNELTHEQMSYLIESSRSSHK